ncbi:B12-binding domain-containing radical SAM protein [Methanocaldococcus fervens]|uniref:Radical SAM domain protein n=1 Tax=Methanocaldococcus fervens (strain DSM 4213 / JCM 15782 / AG86) TaxID=573064 RepID=C7P7Y6_METFA|nr:radical SAM protein [Methanocaldococcus fervens]ACV24668.1 Radical SAM domain protein [Methanocaldococcus fervens AG86]
MIRNVAIIYPNKFKAGISCLAVHILACHLSKYRDLNVGVYFLENYEKIKNFDAIFITLQYENDYFNAVTIVKDLKPHNPNAVFVAGGPCVMENFYPITDFFDAVIVGEIENSEVMLKVINKEFDVEGVYSKHAKKDKVKRIYPKKLGVEDYPIYQPSSEEGAYGKAFLLEIGRGCPRRCRFCLARAIYYPPRFRKLNDLMYLAEEGIKVNKVNKVALIAPSVGDYKYIVELCNFLDEKGVQISPSSLRADTLNDDLMRILKPKTLTIAPEAGSERLREFIKKDINEGDIFNAIELAKKYNVEKVKLYFMVGIPTETDEDIEELITLTKKIKKEIRRVEISVNPMIPKPHTDFEEEEFDLSSKKKIKYIEKALKKENIKVEYENFNSMICQCVLARGDEMLNKYLNCKNPTNFISALKKDKLLDKYLKVDKMPWKNIII